jgi:hypothetical protein
VARRGGSAAFGTASARGGQDFQGAADLDGDGTRELLFAGINNGWNWVNAVAAVRLDPRGSGSFTLYAKNP